MSTTTFCRVRLSRKNATSTTKVAPCMCRAGPKKGSGRLWAIMILSRTSTAYMGVSRAWQRLSGLGISDNWGKTVRYCIRAGTQDARQLARRILERDVTGNQQIEGGLVQQAEGGIHAPAIVPARP